MGRKTIFRRGLGVWQPAHHAPKNKIPSLAANHLHPASCLRKLYSIPLGFPLRTPRRWPWPSTERGGDPAAFCGNARRQPADIFIFLHFPGEGFSGRKKRNWI